MKKTKKPLSTLLEIALKEKEEDFPFTHIETEKEITLEEIAKKKKILMVVCPFCGLHRPIVKTGVRLLQKVKKQGIALYEPSIQSGEYIISERSKFYNPNKIVAFNLYNFKDEPFISIRIAKPRKGFIEIGSIRLKDIQNLPPKYQKIAIKFIKQIIEQAEKFKEYVESLGILQDS